MPGPSGCAARWPAGAASTVRVTRAQAQLDQALAAEREALAETDTDDARFAEAQLDALPRSTAAAVQELSEYRWTSPEAERIYREILDGLRRDVLDQRFQGMRNALQGCSRARAARAAGGQPGAQGHAQRPQPAARQACPGRGHAGGLREFMSKHGDLFPGDPQNVDELVDELARQAAAAERLMASLTPQQREELAGLMAQALGDPDLAAQMAALNDNLRALRPDLTWDRGERMRGDQPLGYGEAARRARRALRPRRPARPAGAEPPRRDPGRHRRRDRRTGARLVGGRRTCGRCSSSSASWSGRAGWSAARTGWSSRPRRCGGSGRPRCARSSSTSKDGRRGEHDIQDAGASGEATGASRRVAVRRRAAARRRPHRLQRGAADRLGRRPRRPARAWRTSRSSRPSAAPRRPWPCAWTSPTRCSPTAGGGR